MQLQDLTVNELKTLKGYLESKRLKGIVDRGDQFDYKFAYHLVRLSYECEMILTEGDLDLRRHNEHLKSIRRGDLKEQDIRDWFSSKEKYLTKLYEESKLRHTPDKTALRNLLLSCLESHYGSLDKIVEKQDKYRATLLEIQSVLDRNGIR